VLLRNLIIALLLLIIVALGVWSLTQTRTEPVDEITTLWNSSGHADRTALAFRDWDEDDPPVIPPFCAKCHSTIGYRDFLGDDGTTPGEVDNPSPIGTTIECTACHNQSALRMESVEFPSGAVITDLDGQGNCMQCHQGRTSTVQIDGMTAGIEDDVVSEELEFRSVHYGPTAATRWGSEVRGGYQYPDREYVGFFEHTSAYQECTQCHDPHSLRINPQQCSPCHSRVAGFGDLPNIREKEQDWDGDGDADEGVAFEIDTLRERLYTAVQEYAATVAGTPIVYSAGTFPYYFIDTDADGVADEDELAFQNAYPSWTPRLLRAAYNYDYIHRDGGAYTHNPRYVIQLLQDSLTDLGQRVQVDTAGMTRP
jgi:hypothetical protein